MRLLLIHADSFQYEVRQKAIKNPEKISSERLKDSMDDVLVAFCTVEKGDEENPHGIALNTAESIASAAKKVHAEKIMVYPYAHLSSELASQDSVVPILEEIEAVLKKDGYEVHRSPFGWYKAFSIKCKGHPLSELSRSITAGEVIEAGEMPEKGKPSKFIVLDPSGEKYNLDLKNVEGCAALKKYPLLKQFILTEEVGRVPHEAPPHIKIMRKLELIDYEPASDVGHFRFYPKGTLLKESLEKFATDLAIKQLNVMKIETPILYRLDQPDIAGQAARFMEKDYRFRSENKDLILRFAGDFGLFRMMKDVSMSYKQLPIRIYELSPSFRLEKKGECVGLKRLRHFTMPDIHCFCKDLKQGMDEYEALFKYYTEFANSMEIDYVVAFRVVKDFFNKNEDWFVRLLKIVGKPAMIELLPEMKHYWVVKHEYQAIDSVGGNAQLSTVQLDIEDSERYSILYTAEDGKKAGCTIVHSSVGSIERWIYAILENAEKSRKKGNPPMLLAWLSPIQARIVPVSLEYLDYADKVAEKLEKCGVRVDIDDREQTVGNKIRGAEIEWIPYVAVVGEKEKAKEIVAVRIRKTGQAQKMMSINDFAKLVDGEIGDKPRLPLYLPKKLSMRPKFV